MDSQIMKWFRGAEAEIKKENNRLGIQIALPVARYSAPQESADRVEDSATIRSPKKQASF